MPESSVQELDERPPDAAIAADPIPKNTDSRAVRSTVTKAVKSVVW